MEHLSGRKSIVSFQLENEFFNKGIGRCQNYDRSRLKSEFAIVKKYAGHRPVILSTSNNWSLPIRSPRPDKVGYSIYRYQHHNGRITRSIFPLWWFRLRANFMKYVLRKEAFCHELQAEPWGPKGTDKLSYEQQKHLMDSSRLAEHIDFAVKTGSKTIDLWGLEWWYQLKKQHNDDSLWRAVRQLI